MPWVEVFAVFLVCHLTGDYLLQTEWQASNKLGGLGRDPERRRALLSHTAVYTLGYLPALVWLAGDHSSAVVALAAIGIGMPHGLQDDGRLLQYWALKVKKTKIQPGPLFMAIDQSFHVVALFLLALVIGR